ncbi:MAG: hypothetical protein NC237_01430 [Eubacterium sp.]|nr:hypothetical protein [Eubacterium sp.]
MCFILTVVCVVGIADGAVGSVYFFEKEVRERVVELGLITEEMIRKRYAVAGIALFIPVLFLVPCMVYFVNGRGNFGTYFGRLRRSFGSRVYSIDWYWVGHTKAWIIPGTEDLMPYIPKKTMIVKWLGTIVGYPLLALIDAFILTLF